VASVINGEYIPLIQQRILDAGFENLDIIPMGADKVLLKSSNDIDVNSIIIGAADIFKSFFTSIHAWNNQCVKFERGVWVRLYGVPLQAWNANFFRLCAFDIGRIMWLDTCMVDRDCLDYARILLATPSLNICLGR